MAALMPLGKRRKGAAAGEEEGDVDGDDEHAVSYLCSGPIRTVAAACFSKFLHLLCFHRSWCSPWGLGNVQLSLRTAPPLERHFDGRSRNQVSFYRSIRKSLTHLPYLIFK
jgi:hypothetical protein